MGKKLKLKVQKNFGEGGTHAHVIREGEDRTLLNGRHKHLFIINGIPFFTELDGEHWHPVTEDGEIGKEQTPDGGAHDHKVILGGDLVLTGGGTSHPHELLADETGTDLSGLHTHVLEMSDGRKITSLLPEDLMDKETRKRVNLEIQSVIVSSNRFKDLQEATQFLETRGFEVKDSSITKEGFVFRQLSRERFKEESLKTFELSDGITAVVGIIDPDKAGDMENPSFDRLKDQFDPSKDTITEEQAAQLAQLKERYATLVNQLKDATTNFIPALNEFVSMSDQFVKNQEFHEFLSGFVDGIQHLENELGKIDLEKQETEDKNTLLNNLEREAAKNENFEKQLRSIKPILKELRDVFEESEGFPNLGRLLIWNDENFDEMILNLPLIRIEGEGTEIMKSLLSTFNLHRITKEELHGLTSHDLAYLQLEEMDHSNLPEERLEQLFKKYFPKNKIVKVRFCNDYGIGIKKGDIDIPYNLNKGIPLPSNSVDEIKAESCLQHLQNDNRMTILKEVHRVLKVGGTFISKTPSTEGRNAFLPIYKSYWNQAVFSLFIKDSVLNKQNPTKFTFEAIELETDLDKDGNISIVKTILRKVK